jgi:hypothetical protein
VRMTTDSVETAAVPHAKLSQDGHVRLTLLLVLTNAMTYAEMDKSKREILQITVTMEMLFRETVAQVSVRLRQGFNAQAAISLQRMYVVKYAVMERTWEW